MRTTRDGARRRREVLAGVVISTSLVAALAGCSDGGGSTSSSSSTSMTQDVLGPTSTSSRPASNDDRCPDASPSPGRRVERALELDADGDRSVDTAEVAVVDDRTIDVTVRHGAGGSSVLRLDDESVATFAAVRIDRVADVDGDGDDDLWIVVGSGAATEVVTVVLAQGCDLLRPQGDVGANAFAIGSTVGNVNGIECTDLDGDGTDDAFLEHAAEAIDQATYRGTTTTWAFAEQGSMLERISTEPLVVGADDPALRRYGELDCGT